MPRSTTPPAPHHATRQQTPGEAQEQDADSGLVEFERTPRSKLLPGKLTERPMIGLEVTATLPDHPGDLFGGLRHVSGIVTRDKKSKQLVFEEQLRGCVRRHTAIPRDANVDKGWSR